MYSYIIPISLGGPQYILRIDPVEVINAEQLDDLIMEVFHKVKEKGGFPEPFSCDNWKYLP